MADTRGNVTSRSRAMIYERTIESVGDLISEVKYICGKFPHREMWFRGQENAAWKLRPSIHRRFTAEEERSMAAQFMLEAPLRYPGSPSSDELPRWLTLMQHYRLPTRLLDWTMSPLVAAYFALAHNADSASAVWGLFPARLNELEAGRASYLSLSGEAVRPFVEAAFRLIDSPQGVRAVVAETIDMRMLVQQAAFTIHGDGRPLDEHPHADDFLVKFVMPPPSQDLMFIELEKSGVSRAFLFPDLENLATSISSRPRVLGRKGREWRAAGAKRGKGRRSRGG